MSEGDPTAKADTRECDQEAAAEAKKPTELGSSPTAAAEAKKTTVLGSSSTAAAPKQVEKKAKGRACGGGRGGNGDRQTPAKRARQTPAKRARQVFLDRIEVAENRKYAAQRDFDEACDAWVDAYSQRYSASTARQAASSHQDSANRDKMRSVEDIHSAKEQLRDYDEEMARLGEEEKDE